MNNLGWWMVGVSVTSWAALAFWLERENAAAALFGMLGPLVAATSSWWVMERTYRRRPERATSVMTGAFVAKMVFFGLYVALIVGGLSVPARPFVVSFAIYFIVLYAMEALYLRRLFVRNPNR